MSTQHPVLNACREKGLLCLYVLSDYVLWLLLLIGLVLGVLAFDWHNLPFIPRETQVIHLDVRDAYSLTKGSPVKLMGVPVGRVTEVTLESDPPRVRVDFVLNPEAPEIPEHAEGAIVASGLGGAKSLEFYAEADRAEAYAQTARLEGDQDIKVTRPYRQKTMWNYQVQVANSLRHGANSLYEALKPIEVGPHKQQVQAILEQVQQFQQQAREFNQKAPELAQKSTEMANQFQEVLDRAQRRLDTLEAQLKFAGQPAGQSRLDLMRQIRETRQSIQAQQQLIQQAQHFLTQQKAPSAPPVPVPEGSPKPSSGDVENHPKKVSSSRKLASREAAKRSEVEGSP